MALFTHMTFIVLTGVMLSSIIVGAYEKKTIHLMFSYPISRRKILFSKMAAVWIFNVSALIASKLILFAALAATSPFTAISAADIRSGSLSFCLELLLSQVAMVGISYIALPIGMKMRSSRATIVASVIIVCLTQGNIGALTLSDSIPIYVLLLILSVLAVSLSVSTVETKDLM